MRAFVLVNVVPDREMALCSALRNLPDKYRIIEVSMLTGRYDCIVEVAAHSVNAIEETVAALRALDEVTEAETCLVVHTTRPALVPESAAGG